MVLNINLEASYGKKCLLNVKNMLTQSMAAVLFMIFSSRYRPIWQATHSFIPVKGWNFPGIHCWHFVIPLNVWEVPFWHTSQSLSRPTSCEDLPILQGKQSVLSLCNWNCPGTQAKHDVAPVLCWYIPGLHVVHSLDRATSVVALPVVQSKQKTCDVCIWYIPGRQARHFAMLRSFWYLPEAHISHFAFRATSFDAVPTPHFWQIFCPLFMTYSVMY